MKKILVIIAVIIVCIISIKEESLVIPASAIRFRIIANSNTIKDQQEKTIIESSLTKYLENLVASENKDSVKNSLVINKDKINDELDKIILENNIQSNYKVSIGNNYFPLKKYKGVKYDAGYYDSLVVTLGRGEGLNWWCVMYPPLCLIDDNVSDYEYTSLVSEIIKKYHMN